MMCMWLPEDSSVGSILSFHLSLGSKDQAPVARLLQQTSLPARSYPFIFWPADTSGWEVTESSAVSTPSQFSLVPRAQAFLAGVSERAVSSSRVWLWYYEGGSSVWCPWASMHADLDSCLFFLGVPPAYLSSWLFIYSQIVLSSIPEHISVNHHKPIMFMNCLKQISR